MSDPPRGTFKTALNRSRLMQGLAPCSVVAVNGLTSTIIIQDEHYGLTVDLSSAIGSEEGYLPKLKDLVMITGLLIIKNASHQTHYGFSYRLKTLCSATDSPRLRPAAEPRRGAQDRGHRPEADYVARQDGRRHPNQAV